MAEQTEQPEQPTDNKPENSNADGGGSEQTEVTFSQGQLDAIVKERLDRAKKSTTAELLEALGVEDLATATKAIKEAEAVKVAQMSELEKSQAETVEAVTALATATAEMAAVKATAAEAVLRSAVLSAAAGFNDPNDAWVHIDKSKINVRTDGTYKGIDEAVAALAKSKPYLVKSENDNLGTPTTSNKAINEAWRNQKENPSTPVRPTIRF